MKSTNVDPADPSGQHLIHRLIHTVETLTRRIEGEPAETHDPIPAPIALTPVEVAARLRKSRAWVCQRMADGSIPFCQVSGRRRLIRSDDLDAFLIARRG